MTGVNVVMSANGSLSYLLQVHIDVTASMILSVTQSQVTANIMMAFCRCLYLRDIQHFN